MHRNLCALGVCLILRSEWCFLQIQLLAIFSAANLPKGDLTSIMSGHHCKGPMKRHKCLQERVLIYKTRWFMMWFMSM